VELEEAGLAQRVQILRVLVVRIQAVEAAAVATYLEDLKAPVLLVDQEL
jgi:hypothetical protein